MSAILLILLIILIFVVLFQIGRTSELSSMLKQEEAINKTRNKWMAWSFLLMFPLMMVCIYYCHQWFQGKMLPTSASDHGQDYDSMFYYTLLVTGFIFLLTQFALFYFSFKYREDDRRTAYFFVHSNKLELIWTILPAIAMTVLVVIGLKNWFKMTSVAPAGAQVVEVIGKQFGWLMRYPGPDGKLGKRNYKLINDANNVLGLDWTDPNTKDDIISTNGELHIQKDKPVELVLGSRDVIHDVGLPHFRMKMDAVPGIPTRMWFTPIITTEEMKKITGNPNFIYEISCDQMCGKGHYGMKGTVIVHDKAGMGDWLAKQQSYFAMNNKPAEEAPVDGKEATVADTVKKITMKN
jgi:cytochrome c oxidase subunit II